MDLRLTSMSRGPHVGVSETPGHRNRHTAESILKVRCLNTEHNTAADQKPMSLLASGSTGRRMT